MGWREAVLGSTSEFMAGEGRVVLTSAWETDLRRHRLSGNTRSVRATVGVAGVYRDAYLPEGRWSPGERWLLEMGSGGRLGLDAGPFDVDVDASSSLGFDTENRRYLRGALSLDAVAPLPGRWSLAARVFGGISAGLDPSGQGDGLDLAFAPRERMFSMGSGDPLQQLGNPLVRSRGALEAPAVHRGVGRCPGSTPRCPSRRW
jgi:hypothetical protein